MFLNAQVDNFDRFSLSTSVSWAEKEKFKSNKKEVLNDLKEYLLEETNTLSADKIQQHLFPEQEVDIFLSHSHQDEDKVISLAILLEKKGFNVFVDSCIWGNAFELLKAIDDKYSYNKSTQMYDYETRNYSTSHVYMILNTALHRMIDASELFLFLGTPNSLTVRNGIKEQSSLQSPWLFSELSFLKHVRRHSRFEVALESFDKKRRLTEMAILDSLQVDYTKPDLDHHISVTSLENWLSEEHHNILRGLTALYANFPKTKEMIF